MLRERLQRQQKESEMRAARGVMRDPAVLAAFGSVLLSWYYYFVSGDREQGLFVGLWPPTILAFASYFRQTRMFNRLMASRVYGDIADRVKQFVPNQ